MPSFLACLSRPPAPSGKREGSGKDTACARCHENQGLFEENGNSPNSLPGSSEMMSARQRLSAERTLFPTLDHCTESLIFFQRVQNTSQSTVSEEVLRIHEAIAKTSWWLVRIQCPPHSPMRGACVLYPSRFAISRIMALDNIAVPITKIRCAAKVVAKRRWRRSDPVARHKTVAPRITVHSWTRRRLWSLCRLRCGIRCQSRSLSGIEGRSRQGRCCQCQHWHRRCHDRCGCRCRCRVVLHDDRLCRCRRIDAGRSKQRARCHRDSRKGRTGTEQQEDDKDSKPHLDESGWMR